MAAESFPALRTYEGFLSGVNLLVPRHIRLLAETFATFVAGEGLLPGVDSDVALKLHFP